MTVSNLQIASRPLVLGVELEQRGIKTGIWIIATGVIITALYLGRSILAPFAIAVFLWLVMESFSRKIGGALKFLPDWASRILGIIIVLAGFGLLIVLLGQGIENISSRAKDYETRIDELIKWGYESLSLPEAPSLSSLIFGEPGQKFLGSIASATSTLSENLIIVLIYVGFLFLAASAWPAKLDALFPNPENREQVRQVSEDMLEGIEGYLWTQTVISVIITLLTYITLITLGVHNALLLCVLIFILNYIPTVGSILAAFLPLLFAVAQPSWPSYMPDNVMLNAGIVFIAVSFWQFSIGNFVQPRMMGDTLNLSSLVVLLSLAIWGALWGIPGMFLSAPLTVLVMIICKQFNSTKWLAIVLSSDGKP